VDLVFDHTTSRGMQSFMDGYNGYNQIRMVEFFLIKLQPLNGKTSMNNLPMLVALNSIKEFHVFIDASNYVVGAILAQNVDNTIDHPI
jgi:hypothetical protein